MPHSTTTTTFPKLERSPFSPSATTGGLHRSSTVPAPKTPGLSYSPSRKRAFLSRHARSKSANMASSAPPAVVPMAALTPTSAPRKPVPPMLRSSSLPSVPTISEGKVQQYAITTTPPTPTTPPAIHQRPALIRSRSNSPTRQYSGSLSPGLTPRSSYYPGSSSYSSSPSASPSLRSASPPAYLLNEGFMPYSYSSASSSSPSTPTSARSRSPSISSLETIPDTPDEEEEAIEAEKKAAAARAAAKKMEEDSDDAVSRRSSLDGRDWGLGVRRVGNTDKRKRWSVCGAEKRADLELETIWEEAMAGAGISDAGGMEDVEECIRDDEDEIDGDVAMVL